MPVWRICLLNVQFVTNPVCFKPSTTSSESDDTDAMSDLGNLLVGKWITPSIFCQLSKSIFTVARKVTMYIEVRHNLRLFWVISSWQLSTIIQRFFVKRIIEKNLNQREQKVKLKKENKQTKTSTSLPGATNKNNRSKRLCFLLWKWPRRCVCKNFKEESMNITDPLFTSK